jgi:hypothetical protein
MKIKDYLNDGLITLDDKLIGTDAGDSNSTKSYTIQDLINFIQAHIDLGVSGTFTTQDNKVVTVVNGAITSIV